jgi:tRNA dimethylallyltransferase
MKEKLLVLIGPTAVGKTKTSIELAKAFNGEIISGDSMQVYRGMDIGTAKIKEEEMESIPHYLIDTKDPAEAFSAAEFQAAAKPLITEMNQRDKLPIIVGGTGLYIRSLTHNYQFSDVSSNLSYRKELESYAAQYGNEQLHEKLKGVDPASFVRIHPNNVKRVIRALEIVSSTGRTMTEHLKEQKRDTPYHLITIGLMMEREKLYERINYRVDQMIEDGLVEEAKSLYEAGLQGSQSVQAIGYKEMFEYFDGKCTLDESIALLKQNSRRYAKRQFTWFRNQMDVSWFDVTEGQFDEKIKIIIEFVAGKLEKEANKYK